MKKIKLTSLILSLLLIAFSGIAQDDLQKQIDSLTNELLSNKYYRESVFLNFKSAFILQNYTNQGMIKNSNAEKERQKFNLSDPNERLRYYKSVYGEKFGDKMLQLHKKREAAFALFQKSFNLRYDLIKEKEVYKAALKKSSIIILKENDSMNNSNFKIK